MLSCSTFASLSAMISRSAAVLPPRFFFFPKKQIGYPPRRDSFCSKKIFQSWENAFKTMKNSWFAVLHAENMKKENDFPGVFFAKISTMTFPKFFLWDPQKNGSQNHCWDGFGGPHSSPRVQHTLVASFGFKRTLSCI